MNSAEEKSHVFVPYAHDFTTIPTDPGGAVTDPRTSNDVGRDVPLERFPPELRIEMETTHKGLDVRFARWEPQYLLTECPDEKERKRWSGLIAAYQCVEHPGLYLHIERGYKQSNKLTLASPFMRLEVTVLDPRPVVALEQVATNAACIGFLINAIHAIPRSDAQHT